MQRLLDTGERRLVGIARNLPDRQTTPAVGGPAFRHITIPPRRLVAHWGLTWSCITSGVGGRSTISDIRISMSMKHESRLGQAASGKRVSAILRRRPVPAVPKSRDLAGATHRP